MNRTVVLLICLVTVACGIETCIGIMQLLGFCHSSAHLFIITGSFGNPGPYGGFLAVCISLLAAYYILEKKKTTKPGVLMNVVAAVVLLAFIILPFTKSRASYLAIGCSLVLFLAGYYRKSQVLSSFLKKYGVALACSVAVVGICAYLIKKPSADGRFFINKICVKTMAENGLKGSGLGSFSGAYGKTQYSFFKEQIDKKGQNDMDWRVINEHDRITADSPNKAFNEYFLIGVEAGPVVMLLFIAIIIIAVITSYQRETIWCYGLCAFAVFALFSYPLHYICFRLFLLILLLLSILDKGNGSITLTRKHTSTPKRVIWISAYCLCLILLSFVIVGRDYKTRGNKIAKSIWEKAEKRYNMGYYDYVLEDFESIYPYMNHDYKYLFAYGQSLSKTGYYEKSDSILEIGTEISSDPMFWNIMGNNSLASGRYREAEERYKHAFHMLPNRLYPLCLLAKLYYAENDTIRFLEMADMVDSFIPKIESAETETLRADIRQLRTTIELDR